MTLPALVLAVAAVAIPRYHLVAASDPNPKVLISTAPLFLDKVVAGRLCCSRDTLRARSWPRLQIGQQLRAVDWAHPRFAPVVVATGPETRPGQPCTLSVAHGQPGDTFVHRWVNRAPRDSASCWGGAKSDSTSWKPLDAAVP